MGERVTQRGGLPMSNLIGMVFGGLWAWAGGMALAGPWRAAVLLIAGLAGAGFMVRLWRDSRQTAQRSGIFRATPYWIALVLEIVLIVIASKLLPRYGYGTYLLQVVGVIVGLHFLGLWRATHSSRMVWIAVGMCVVSGLGLLLPTSQAGAVRPGDAWTALGNAVVLWAGASRVK